MKSTASLRETVPPTRKFECDGPLVLLHSQARCGRVSAGGCRQAMLTLERTWLALPDRTARLQGFDKSTTEDDFAVRGGAVEDPDFSGGSDRIQYHVAVSSANGPLTVSAELLYQSVSYPFVADLRENDGDLIDRFAEMYDAASQVPMIVANAAQTVQ